QPCPQRRVGCEPLVDADLRPAECVINAFVRRLDAQRGTIELLVMIRRARVERRNRGEDAIVAAPRRLATFDAAGDDNWHEARVAIRALPGEYNTMRHIARFLLTCPDRT